MRYENLCFEKNGAVAVVTLNRPSKRNALSLGLMQELLDCFGRIGADRQLRAVILAAAGKVYSSGHDLSELVERDINDYRQIFDVCAELMTRIQSIPQPVIAEVQGMATAAGCQLVATCDLAVAAEEASFATPGVRIGLFCTTPMVALSRAVGRKRALQMLLTGDAIDAKTAAEWLPPHERAFGLAIFNSGAAIGSVLAPPVIVWIQYRYGWQTTFVATGALGFVARHLVDHVPNAGAPSLNDKWRSGNSS